MCVCATAAIPLLESLWWVAGVLRRQAARRIEAEVRRCLRIRVVLRRTKDAAKRTAAAALDDGEGSTVVLVVTKSACNFLVSLRTDPLRDAVIRMLSTRPASYVLRKLACMCRVRLCVP